MFGALKSKYLRMWNNVGTPEVKRNEKTRGRSGTCWMVGTSLGVNPLLRCLVTIPHGICFFFSDLSTKKKKCQSIKAQLRNTGDEQGKTPHIQTTMTTCVFDVSFLQPFIFQRRQQQRDSQPRQWCLHRTQISNLFVSKTTMSFFFCCSSRCFCCPLLPSLCT